MDSGSFAPETVSGDLLRGRRDHLDVNDIFEHGLPITEAAALIASNRAVTLNLNHDYLNFERHGRYLEIDSANDNIREFVIGFDGADIAAALEGIDTDDILSAQLFLWNESGRNMDLQFSAFTSPFNENTIVSSDELSGFTAIGSVHVNGDIGEKRFDIPRNILLDWLSDPTGAYGLLLEASEYGGKLRFSSDETSRPPTLVVSYRKRSLLPAVAAPQVYPTQTDNEQCAIWINSESGVLREGDAFVFNISVTDNTAIDYYNFKVWRDDGTTTAPQSAYIYNPGHTSLGYELRGTLNSDAAAALSYLHIDIYADDVDGLAPQCKRFARVPIYKKDDPKIETAIEYLDVIDVKPDFYRLIKNDKQRIRITGSASDEHDAIDYIQLWLPGEATPRIFYTDHFDVTWKNTPHINPFDDFVYTVIVHDTSGSSSTFTSEPVPIRDWDELHLYNHALTFQNFGRETDMSKTYLDYIYGTDEVTGRLGNYTVKAKWWYTSLKGIARGGNCYGMSGTSIALATGQESLAPGNLQPGATTSAELDPPTDRVKIFVNAKQASQLSKKVLEELYRYHDHHQNDYQWTLNKVLNSLNEDFATYGSLNIFEDHIGHSLVPWMARQFPSGDWKVYVYDSNKVVVVNAIQKNLGEPVFNNERGFPFVEFNLSTDSWQYIIGWDGDDHPVYWNDDILFTSHDSIVGNSAYNEIRSDLHMRDHSLPSVLRSIWDNISGLNVLSTENNDNIFLRIEDDDGNSELMSENFGGNGAIPIRTLSGSTSSAGLYLLPGDKTMTIKVYGQKSGDYALKLLSGHLVISIEGKHTEGQLVDTYAFTPDPENPDSIKLQILSATANDPFVIRTSFAYAKALKQEIVSAEKAYQISNIRLGENMPLDLTLNNYAEELKVHSEEKSGFSFDLSVEETDENGDLATVFTGNITPTVISGGPVYDFNLTKAR